MKSTILFLFFALAASTCRAKVKIIQGNDISIEFDKRLTITCTNDKTSDVEFRHEEFLVAYCLGKHGCSIDDGRFSITQNTYAGRNEYILKSNDVIQTDLCGVYECNDLLYPSKDSAIVSIIGFDNKTYTVIEEKDTIYLTTACIFNVSLSDMKIVWNTYDSTTLKLLDKARMGNSMTPFNNVSVCSDKCGTLYAYSFTFGLHITDQEQGYTNAFIETKIIHPDYTDKPLTWRSSETFLVKDSSPQTTTSGVLMIVIASVGVTVLIAGAIYAVVIRFQRKRIHRQKTSINIDHMEEECLLLSESSEGIKRGEKKLSDSVSTIDTCVREQGKRSTNFKTRVDTAPLEELCWLLSDSSKRIKHRDEWKHSQSEGAIDASVRDKGKKKHQLRNRWKHSQTESPINVCIGVQGAKKHQLRNTVKHSQSESVIDACVRILRKKKHQLRNRWKHRHSEAAIYHFEEEIALIDDSETCSVGNAPEYHTELLEEQRHKRNLRSTQTSGCYKISILYLFTLLCTPPLSIFIKLGV